MRPSQVGPRGWNKHQAGGLAINLGQVSMSKWQMRRTYRNALQIQKQMQKVLHIQLTQWKFSRPLGGVLFQLSS